MASGSYGAYQNPPWGPPGRGGPVGRGGPWQHGQPWPFRPLWIVAVILAFMLWWPVGLLVLGLMIGSKRMACRNGLGRGGWKSGAGPFAGWRGFCGSGDRPAASSGNAAFDEYRAETLRRLEDEQKEFSAFLERLRVAKDKAEFDAFMADRRQRPQAEPPAEPSAA